MKKNLSNSINNRRGFSLIELMVAITILAIISSIGFVAYGQVQKKARDTKRKQDLRSIRVMLELYKQNKQGYPLAATPVNSSSGESWIPALIADNYTQNLPLDPTLNGTAFQKNAIDTNFGYLYYAPNDAAALPGSCPQGNVTLGGYYMLVTHLEDANDPDRTSVRQPKWCDGTAISTANWGNNSFIVTPDR
jgi:prepilin-type N-terminal cleavage/methylation domain-containing protein